MNEDEVPTRADIAEILASIPSAKNKFKKNRNDLRRDKVKAALPVEVFEIVETDLISYQEWEAENAS